MTATETKNHEAFSGILGALRAVYEAEIARLADAYRPRILAGEFSGETPPGPIRGVPQDEPRYLALERELEKTHPWVTGGERERLAVVACSRWLKDVEEARIARDGTVLDVGWDAEFADRLAAECMSHDILGVAASRGWVRRLRTLQDPRPYALKVA